MVMGWCSLFCGLIWGALSDIVGRRFALMMVYLVQAIAYGLVSLWPVSAGFILATVLFGLTAWSIPGIMAAACGDVFGIAWRRQRWASLRSSSVWGRLFHRLLPVRWPTQQGLRLGFSMASTVAILGAVGSLLLPADRRHGRMLFLNP
ncbi:MAG: hypothetical protein CM1200mP20_14880 [Pseudomonadota bacterium]|nr:MAG: hypothetical protein CM1200mP20_14880 [Pseudomonadota bacterium]